MDQASSQPIKIEYLGVIFTDEEGFVILADENAISLLEIFDVQDIIGEPLYKVLGVSPHETEQLISSIRSLKYIKNYPLKVVTQKGQLLDLSLEVARPILVSGLLASIWI